MGAPSRRPWLRAPQDSKTGRVGGKVWWWLMPFVLLSAALEALPINPSGPLPRDFPSFIADGGDRVDRFYQGAWGLFALSVLLVFLAPVVEELFFRGLLLPRMQKVCGRFDWIVNGTIFTAYHLHQPWGMPTTLLTGIFGQAYPAKRFRSIWISIVCHTLELPDDRHLPEPRARVAPCLAFCLSTTTNRRSAASSSPRSRDSSPLRHRPT